jgi:fibronectin-binding autotransporter adhesin
VLHITKTGADTLTLGGTASTYTGVTTLGGGVLSVASINNGGLASSIGQSSADPANLVFNGGTLRYASTASQSTDRLFTLGVGAGAGRIDASSSNNSAVGFTGSGAIAFTGTGARTLTLAGTSTGANALAPIIGDGGGGATSVVKSAGGTWNLTGANTYTGGTTVQAGRLNVKRLHENNAVTIDAGATLTVLESAPGLLSGHPAGNNASVSRPSSLTVAPGGTLDLTNNDLILDYSGSTPIAAIEGMIRSGYNVSGNWAGSGITSAVAASDGNYILAIADNAALAAPFGSAQGGPLFAGADVDLTTILIKFTHRADINLDGVLTPDDAAVFGGNYDENQPAVWATGDMDYNGLFTPDDAAIFGGAYDESLASLPEPGILGLLAFACVGFTRRRRVSH